MKLQTYAILLDRLWLGATTQINNNSVVSCVNVGARAISQGLGLFIKFNRKTQHQMILIELWPTLHTLQKMFNWLVNKYPHFKLNLACSGLLSCRVLLMFWSARETKTSQTLRCARWFTGSLQKFSAHVRFGLQEVCCEGKDLTKPSSTRSHTKEWLKHQERGEKLTIKHEDLFIKKWLNR